MESTTMNDENGNDRFQDMYWEPGSDIISVAYAQHVGADEVLPEFIDNEEEYDIQILEDITQTIDGIHRVRYRDTTEQHIEHTVPTLAALK